MSKQTIKKKDKSKILFILKIKTSHKQKQNIISFNAMQTHCRRGNSSMSAEWSLLLFNGIKSKKIAITTRKSVRICLSRKKGVNRPNPNYVF